MLMLETLPMLPAADLDAGHVAEDVLDGLEVILARRRRG
jgi:hypothetical protein